MRSGQASLQGFMRPDQTSSALDSVQIEKWGVGKESVVQTIIDFRHQGVGIEVIMGRWRR